MQEKLRALGFYAGPVNGDIGPNTQAALAQFQLSIPIPASGQLDEQTVAALGVKKDATVSGGASEGSSAVAMPAQSVNGQHGGTIETGAKSGSGATGSTSTQ